MVLEVRVKVTLVRVVIPYLERQSMVLEKTRCVVRSASGYRMKKVFLKVDWR
jgi:hypothetical protein